MTLLKRRSSGSTTDERAHSEDRPSLVGVPVREDDIEQVKGLRTIAVIFRGMAIVLILLMIMQVFFAVSSTVPISVGVVAAEAVRLIIFAGLLWGVGDLAVLFIKSHYDLRATRILSARIEYLLRERESSDGDSPSAGAPRSGHV